MNEIQTDHGPMTPQALMDELLYACYVHNRRRSPHIKPEAWAQVLPNVPAMERRFRVESES